VTCRELPDEFVRTLAYPKFRLSPKEISSLLHKELLPFVEIVDISGRTDLASRDPDDDVPIRCALAGGCSWLVSGDADLLKIGRYEGVGILPPRVFLDDVLGG
jgi:predicted nucleic acid-binding protein